MKLHSIFAIDNACILLVVVPVSLLFKHSRKTMNRQLQHSDNNSKILQIP